MRKGRFGPYVQHGKTVANLPRGVMMEEITLDEAVALLAEKGKQLRPRGAAGRRGRAAAAAKPRTRRATAGRQGAGQGEGQAGQAAGPEGQTRRAEARRRNGLPAAKTPAKKKAAARGKKAAAATAGRQRV